jgi:hypothetical protein
MNVGLPLPRCAPAPMSHSRNHIMCKPRFLVAVTTAMALGCGGTKLPADPIIQDALRQSDDYTVYKTTFLNGAKTLLSSGACTLDQLKNHGGFLKSPPPPPSSGAVPILWYAAQASETAGMSTRLEVCISSDMKRSGKPRAAQSAVDRAIREGRLLQ